MCDITGGGRPSVIKCEIGGFIPKKGVISYLNAPLIENIGRVLLFVKSIHFNILRGNVTLIYIRS